MKPTAHNALADYYRVDGVTIRVSVLYPTPPVCLSCRRNDCGHVEAFLAKEQAA